MSNPCNELSGNLPRVSVAALLADVGLVQARATGSDSVEQNKFQGWLKDSGLGETAEDIVRWRDIIDESRALALGGLLAEGKKQNLSLPLVNSFSKVSFQGKYHDCWTYFPASKMGLSPAFPANEVKKISAEDYRVLWEGLEKEIKQLRVRTPNTLLPILEKYTSFIPYCPGSEEEPLSDIPFFDQVRVTAAIASSLYYAITEGKESLSNVADRTASRFLLIGGDFSGVQPFIYNISSKGALKGLRGRSFFLEFLTEHVIHELLAPLGLSRCNIIFSGGSRFNLFFPNCESATKHVKDVRDKLNRYFWEEHNAQLYLALEWVELRGLDLLCLSRLEAQPEPIQPPLAKRFEDLAGMIDAKKLTKFVPYLGAILEPKSMPNREKEGEIHSRLVKREEKYEGECPRCGNREAYKCQFSVDRGAVEGCQICLNPERISFDECEVCHKEDFLFPLPYQAEEIAKGDVPLACSFCCDVFHVGEHLPSTKYIMRVEGRQEEKIALTIGDAHYVFLNRESPELSQKSSAIWVVNDLDSRLYKEGRAYPFLLAVYPREEEVAKKGEEESPGKVATEFGTLAGQSIGIKRIGALRMDVDNLGSIATGRGFFKVEERNSLSRISAISRSLTNLFKLYINEFCRGNGLPFPQTRVIEGDENETVNKKRKVIIIYSGGDDVFVIGTWNDIAELAFDLYDCFRRYTSDNPDVTMSAGVVVREHGYPLHHLAEDAHKAEKNAKENKWSEGDRKKEKDSLALFFPSLVFPEGARIAFPSGKELAERLLGLLEQEDVRGALKWLDGDFPAPSALNLLKLTKWLVKELGDGEQNRVLQLKSGSRALIYQLLNVVDMRRTEGKLFFPLLYYTLSSPAAGRKVSDELETYLLNTETISYLHPALTWVDWLSREK